MTSPKDFDAPDLSGVIDAAKRDVFARMNCVKIGQIESFDSTTQLAEISLVIKQVVGVSPTGVKTYQDNPTVIKECPCFTLFGGDSFLSMPITAGDTCIVLFNDREIDNWLYEGGVQPTTTTRKHDISDAIAIVGIRSLTDSISAYLPNGVRLQFNASAKIDVLNNAINSLAQTWTHTGDLHVTGNMTVDGIWYGNNGGQMIVDTDIIQQHGNVLSAGNGATGSFERVTVANGIVTGGS